MSWLNDLLTWFVTRPSAPPAAGGKFGGAGATESFGTQEDINQSAGQMLIRFCEGTDGDNGYRALFGWDPKRNPGQVFDSFTDHPQQYFEYTDKAGQTHRTSAAGAYQATYTTWKDFIRECGPHDFSPASQDAFALWLIAKCGALEDLRAGRLRAFIDKCGGRWASLPSATVAQPHRTFEYCQQKFVQAGGQVAA
jgi:muramidase (phage lysozyme)